jgi:hypothetical protein
MAQYRPLYRATEFQEIGRMLTASEYDKVKRLFKQSGVAGFYQELPQLDDRFCIDFKKRKSEPLTGS